MADPLVDLPARPRFAEKAGRVLDLYDRVFEGKRLRPDEYAVCADDVSKQQRQTLLEVKRALEDQAPKGAAPDPFEAREQAEEAKAAGRRDGQRIQRPLPTRPISRRPGGGDRDGDRNAPDSRQSHWRAPLNWYKAPVGELDAELHACRSYTAAALTPSRKQS